MSELTDQLLETHGTHIHPPYSVPVFVELTFLWALPQLGGSQDERSSVGKGISGSYLSLYGRVPNPSSLAFSVVECAVLSASCATGARLLCVVGDEGSGREDDFAGSKTPMHALPYVGDCLDDSRSKLPTHRVLDNPLPCPALFWHHHTLYGDSTQQLHAVLQHPFPFRR